MNPSDTYRQRHRIDRRLRRNVVHGRGRSYVDGHQWQLGLLPPPERQNVSGQRIGVPGVPQRMVTLPGNGWAPAQDDLARLGWVSDRCSRLSGCSSKRGQAGFQVTLSVEA